LKLRPLVASDQDILWDIFHVALWDPPPAPLRPRAILEHPDVRIYAEDWGRREGDVGIAAEVDGRVAGACWMRLVAHGKGLAWIDDETPQLGIALLPRGRFRRVSLTVHPENPAQRLYRRCGFEPVGVRRTYLLMVNELRREP
jgi:RimJ/RimL family protein N-acetyltransferase